MKPDAPVSASWAVLDERRRGTRFIELPIKSVLNSPQQTGMNFWSLNPYVGCEFGCTYCYARYAHRYVVERGSAKGAPGPAVWDDETFEREIFVKTLELAGGNQSRAAQMLGLCESTFRFRLHKLGIASRRTPSPSSQFAAAAQLAARG